MAAVALRRWTRDEYDRMVDAGILGPDDRVELVDGEIVIMTPQKSRHAAAIQLAIRALRPVFGDAFDVRSQMPLALDPASEPEPDIAIVAGSPADYIDAHPSTAVLIVEVADSSLTFDRLTKAAVYARAGITDYWLVNLVDRVVEVRRDPQPSTATPVEWRFASVRTLRAGEMISPLARPDAGVAVTDLLP